jgi:hypothetical protein
MSLNKEDHADLNQTWNEYPGGKKAKEKRIEELKQRYKDDPKALEQIDIYDHNSPYRIKFTMFRDALLSGDTYTETELRTWFRTNYPLTSSLNK